MCIFVPLWSGLPFFLRSCGRVCARLYARVLRRYTACRHTPRALRLLSRSLVAMETVWVGCMPQGIRRAHRGHKFKGHVGDRQILQKTKNKGNSSLVAKQNKKSFCNSSFHSSIHVVLMFVNQISVNGKFRITAKFVSWLYLFSHLDKCLTNLNSLVFILQCFVFQELVQVVILMVASVLVL